MGDDLYQLALEGTGFDALQPRLDSSDRYDRNEAVSEEDRLTVWDGAGRRIVYHHGFDRWYPTETLPEEMRGEDDRGASDIEAPVHRYVYTGGATDAFQEALEEDHRFERDPDIGTPFYTGPGCTALIQSERVDIKVDAAWDDSEEPFYDLSAYGFSIAEAVIEDGDGHEFLAAEFDTGRRTDPR